MTRDLFNAVQLTKDIYWVGAVDWGIRDFHGYTTSRGTTYNAYLIMGETITLVDTVKTPFYDEMMRRIASVTDPGNIDVIISNHSEMDHTGSLPRTIEDVKPKAVYASKMGVKALTAHFHRDLGITVAGDGMSIDLGDRTAVFYETRMLHWPDSMVTWLPDDKVLFSQDAFGMHVSGSYRFSDEIDRNVLEYSAREYFANILLPYSDLIPRAINKLVSAGVAPEIIAPDHGPIHRTAENIETILGWYSCWAEQRPTRRAVIVYDTMWGSTATMARAVGEGFMERDVEMKIMPLGGSHRSDIAAAMLDAGALVIGSPTLNRTLFPTVADIMYYLKGLKPRNLVGGVFGSHGWSGGAIGEIERIFDDMKIERPVESVSSLYVPEDEVLNSCRVMGQQLADALKSTFNCA
jgi:flavorubredoxin